MRIKHCSYHLVPNIPTTGARKKEIVGRGFGGTEPAVGILNTLPLKPEAKYQGVLTPDNCSGTVRDVRGCLLSVC
ncbi:unnamed protein product [Allacma fusca]|uniref:Uncharacterized protein n=1 Tax=Allacma fusca TaxID=39272 RepID=A0A8J2KQR8_9HEXA|nr:unnamed protein product [Allacma fusca]